MLVVYIVSFCWQITSDISLMLDKFNVTNIYDSISEKYGIAGVIP